MRVGATFLTSKKFDKPSLINTLKESIKKFSENDKKLLKKIIFDFENDNFTLIKPPQIDFLEKNPKSRWAEYLVFRYKFTNFPKDLRR